MLQHSPPAYFPHPPHPVGFPQDFSLLLTQKVTQGSLRPAATHMKWLQLAGLGLLPTQPLSYQGLAGRGLLLNQLPGPFLPFYFLATSEGGAQLIEAQLFYRGSLVATLCYSAQGNSVRDGRVDGWGERPKPAETQWSGKAGPKSPWIPSGRK